MVLCKTCQSFDIQAFGHQQPKYRGYLIKDCTLAASDGCSFCSMLVSNLEPITTGYNRKLLGSPHSEGRGFLEALRSSPRDWWGWFHNLLWPAWVNLTVERGEVAGVGQSCLGIVAILADVPSVPGEQYHSRNTLRLNVAGDDYTPAKESHDIIGQLYIEPSTWSPSNLRILEEWHRNCRTQHPECSTTFSGTKTFDVADVLLPTRCLEITAEGSGIDPVPSYVLSNTAGQRGRYTILSHRWGNDTETYKTTKSNLPCMMASCDQSCRLCHGVVPSTTALFQDAFKLSISLGLKYIWIDSLCIVQDDADDWDRESVKMADYYQHAWISICATAVTTNGGLFGPVAEEYSSRITRLPYMDSQGNQQGHFYVQCMEEAILSRDYDANISKSNILRRGWVYQEWMLSRRLLTFSGAGLYVHCQRGGLRALHGDVVRADGKRDFGYKQLLNIDMSGIDSCLSSWLRVVETYSGLELTKITQDRLVALSGLTREVSEAISHCTQAESRRCRYRYASGLWLPHVQGLLWEQAQGGERHQIKGFPTWSWASMAAPMRDHQGNFQLNRFGQQMFSGMGVRWAEEVPSGLKRLCSVEDVCSISVDETFRPHFESSHSPSSEIPATEARFSALQIRGQLLLVRVYGHFSENDASAAAHLTQHRSVFGRDLWRGVAVEQDPDFIAGWASLEYPDFQTDVAVAQDNSLYALVITSTSQNWGLGHWWKPSRTFMVLYLRRKTVNGIGDCYERVGTGRLFGQTIEGMVQESEQELIWLI